jgi:hypothetical protein
MERRYESLVRLSYGNIEMMNFLDSHFYPQNWQVDLQQNFLIKSNCRRCDFNTIMKNYHLIRYDSESAIIIPRVIEFLQKRDVSSYALNYIKKSTLKERTHHSTFNWKYRKFFEQRLRSSPYLMNLLVKMYYHDFQIFNYTIPIV